MKKNIPEFTKDTQKFLRGLDKVFGYLIMLLEDESRQGIVYRYFPKIPLPGGEVFLVYNSYTDEALSGALKGVQVLK